MSKETVSNIAVMNRALSTSLMLAVMSVAESCDSPPVGLPIGTIRSLSNVLEYHFSLFSEGDMEGVIETLDSVLSHYNSGDGTSPDYLSGDINRLFGDDDVGVVVRDHGPWSANLIAKAIERAFLAHDSLCYLFRASRGFNNVLKAWIVLFHDLKLDRARLIEADTSVILDNLDQLPLFRA